MLSCCITDCIAHVVLTLVAAPSNSRSPLVAVDTRVEHRTGEQKTIVPTSSIDLGVIYFRHMVNGYSDRK